MSSSRNMGCNTRSARTSKAIERCWSSTLVLKQTSSLAVKASRLPPSASTERAMSSAERVVVPLNSMCSMKCVMPFCSGVSRREPAPTQMPTETERTCCMASEITRTPFESVVISMSLAGLVDGIIARRETGSRRRRTLPFGKSGNAASAFRPDHLLRVVLGIHHRRQGLPVDELHHFVAVQDLAHQQRLGDLHHRFRVFLHNGCRGIVAFLHQLLHLLINADGGLFAVVAMLRDLAAQENLLFLLAVAQGPELAHAPLANHLASQVGGALDIVARPGGHVVHVLLFGNAPGHEDGQLRLQVILVVGMLVVDGQLHGHAERHAARDNGDLVQRVGVGRRGRLRDTPCCASRRRSGSWTCARRPSGSCPWPA